MTTRKNLLHQLLQLREYSKNGSQKLSQNFLKRYFYICFQRVPMNSLGDFAKISTEFLKKYDLVFFIGNENSFSRFYTVIPVIFPVIFKSFLFGIHQRFLLKIAEQSSSWKPSRTLRGIPQ